MQDLVLGLYQHLPFAVPNDVFSQDMTRISPLFRMLEVRPHRTLIHHVGSHLVCGIIAAEQHARLAYSGATFEGTVEDVMLVGQVFCILYC